MVHSLPRNSGKKLELSHEVFLSPVAHHLFTPRWRDLKNAHQTSPRLYPHYHHLDQATLTSSELSSQKVYLRIPLPVLLQGEAGIIFKIFNQVTSPSLKDSIDLYHAYLL